VKLIYYSNRTYFRGDSLETKGLGGSESCLINLTKSLKSNYPKDMDIIVYNGYRPKPEIYDGVLYKSARDFVADCRNFKTDVFISLRETFPFTLPYIDAKIKLLHSQDDKHEKELQQLQQMDYARFNIDAFLAISRYAGNSIKQMFPEKKVFLQRNGYNENLTLNQVAERNPVAVYTSTPYRGLDVLAEIWPEISARCNQRSVTPELWVFGDMSLYNWSNKDFDELFSYLRSIPNVKVFGAVPQKELYASLKMSKVMLYPNHFLETGCMAVLEALACGNWVVTTDLGALGEQVIEGMNGNLIPGDSHTPEYKQKFISLAVEALCENKNPKTDKKVIFSWKEQADNLLNIVREIIKN
jgi:glycosyltransferase involved in cell wall biosynthesis